MSLPNGYVQRLGEDTAGLSAALPDVADAYVHFTEQCFAPGELDERTKQLIALGVSLYANHESSTYYHLQEARAKGASDRQIMETAAVASSAASRHALSHGMIGVQQTPRSGIQDYLQNTEFADEMGWQGIEFTGAGSVSPSY